MKIQTKTLAIILSSFLILALLLSFALNKIVTESYVQLEKNDVHGDLQRTLNLIKIEQDNLSLLTVDWAIWDDTYEFIKNPNKKYIESNLVESTFTESKLSIIAYVNRAGKIIFGSAYDSTLETKIPLPKSFLPHLQLNKPLLQSKNSDDGVSGIISLPEGVFFVSSVPILTSNGDGPSPGTLIMARRFDKAFTEHLSKNLNFDVSIFPYEKLDAKLKHIANQLNNKNKFILVNNNEKSNSGYSFISTIYNKPSFLLKIDIGRPIYQQGKKTIYLMIVSIFIIIFILVVLVYVLLQIIILNRLSKLSSQVNDINNKKNERIKLYEVKTDKYKNDEIEQLTHSINNMLSTIYESNIDLEKAKKIAESASKAKSEFLSTMNHELRTPLHVVTGYSQLLSNTNLDEKQEGYVNSILTGSSSLLNVINDMLDYSKIESGQLSMDKKKMSLSFLIDDIKHMFGISLSEEDLYFDVTISQNIPESIMMDE